MTVGMSAPPIGTINSTPKTKPSRTRIGTIQVDVGENVRTMISRIAAPSTVKLK